MVPNRIVMNSVNFCKKSGVFKIPRAIGFGLGNPVAGVSR